MLYVLLPLGALTTSGAAVFAGIATCVGISAVIRLGWTSRIDAAMPPTLTETPPSDVGSGPDGAVTAEAAKLTPIIFTQQPGETTAPDDALFNTAITTGCAAAICTTAAAKRAAARMRFISSS